MSLPGGNFLFQAQGNPIVTSWATYAPTSSWGITNTTYTGQWRRVGDTMDVQVTVSLAGAPINAQLSVALPTGFTMNVAKFSFPTPDAGIAPLLGQCLFEDSSSAMFWGRAVYLTPTTTVVYAMATGSSYASQAATSATVPFTFGANDSVDIKFSVPILGW